MKNTTILTFISALSIFLFSCGNERKEAVPADTATVIISDSTVNQTSAYAAACDEFRKTLNGAAFGDISLKKEFYFSNAESKDLFQLNVPAGRIAETRSVFSITTSDGRIIYGDTLPTAFFAQYVSEPDTVPTSGGETVYYKYLLDHLKTVTKEKVEAYALKKVNTFFDDHFVEKSEIDTPDNDEYISDKETFQEVISDPGTKIIWFPCFSCDEGVDYIGYSKQNKKAVVILSQD